MSNDAAGQGPALSEGLGAASEAWVCPWGICTYDQAQACRNTIGHTRKTRGCGNYFAPGITPTMARFLVRPAHTDHPLRHFDRTCPGCVDERA